MTDRYILNAKGEPVACDDLDVWARYIGANDGANRRVGLTVLGDVKVSTVFLGLNHRFHGWGPPVLWETMVFGGALDGHCVRYESEQDAILGHDQTVLKVKGTEQ